MKAEAIGIGDSQNVTTVAVKMVKGMVTLGIKHLHIAVSIALATMQLVV